ncbi:MAG: hypothetical protein K0S29_904 [Gammaproteobacteria bacterium]|jgi:hypothetical protein|nr:hypothetical protein [Gammaproteobacteria bacterium]
MLGEAHAGSRGAAGGRQEAQNFVQLEAARRRAALEAAGQAYTEIEEKKSAAREKLNSLKQRKKAGELITDAEITQADSQLMSLMADGGIICLKKSKVEETFNLFNKLMDIPEIPELYQEFKTLSHPSHQQKKSFIQKLVSKAVANSKYKASYDLYEAFILRLHSDIHLDKGIHKLLQAYQARVTSAHIKPAEKRAFVLGLKTKLERVYPEKDAAKINELAEDLATLAEHISGISTEWQRTPHDLFTRKLNNAEAGLALDEIIKYIHSCVVPILRNYESLKQDRRRLSDDSAHDGSVTQGHAHERSMEYFSEHILEGLQGVLNSDSLSPIIYYLMATYTENNELSSAILDHAEYLDYKDNDALASNYITYMRTGLSYSANYHYLDLLFHAELADLDLAILETLETYPTHIASLTSQRAVLTHLEPKIPTLTEHLKQYKRVIENSKCNDQSSLLNNLATRTDFLKIISPQRFYDYLASLELHPNNFKQKEEILNEFAAKHPAVVKTDRKLLLRHALKSYAKARPNESMPDQTIRLQASIKLAEQLKLSLLQTIDQLSAMQFENEAAIANQRFAVRDLLAKAKQLPKNDKMKFNFGIEQREDKKDSDFAKLMQIKKKQSYAKIGEWAAGILVPAAFILLCFAFPPVGAGIIAAYAIGGWALWTSAIYAGNKLCAKAFDRYLIKKDIKAINCYLHPKPTQPKAVAKKAKAYISPSAKKFDRIFIASSLLIGVAIIGVMVACPPAAVLALPLAFKALAVMGIAVASAVGSTLGGFSVAKLLTSKSWFRKKTQANRSTYGMTGDSTVTLLQHRDYGSFATTASASSNSQVLAGLSHTYSSINGPTGPVLDHGAGVGYLAPSSPRQQGALYVSGASRDETRTPARTNAAAAKLNPLATAELSPISQEGSPLRRDSGLAYSMAGNPFAQNALQDGHTQAQSNGHVPRR